MLHLIKYHKAECFGVFIGRKVDKRVVIEDTIPLFHTRVLSGPLEIAFEMIESTIVNDKSKMVGVYEAPLLITG